MSALVTMLDADAGLPLSAIVAALGALSNQTDSPDVRRALRRGSDPNPDLTLTPTLPLLILSLT